MTYRKRNKLGLCYCFVLIVSILSLSSCKKEKVYPDPDIDFIREEGFVYSDTTLPLNQEFKIGLQMDSRSDEMLIHYNTTVDKDGRVTSMDNAIFEKSYRTEIGTSKNIAATEIWTFYCRDRDSRESEHISITVRLDTSYVFGGIKHMPSILLGAQGSNDYGHFYSLSEEKVMTLSEGFANQQAVNFAYYYDTMADDKNTIASPGSNIDASIFAGDQGTANWTVKNTTRFIQASAVTASEFEACINDSLIIANTFDYQTGKRKAKSLSAGQVYSFVTNGGKNGMFLVKEVKGDVEGSIEISLKILDE